MASECHSQKLFANFFSTRNFDGSRVEFVKKIFKGLAIAFLSVVVMFGGCVFLLGPKPPKEAKLIQNFNEHRAAFEQLRDMLLADGQVIRLADWGVETTNSAVSRIPPEGNFPLARYKEYLALLKQVNGKVAYHDKGGHLNPGPGIMLWGYGFGGDTMHIGICWMDQAPTNQIATLEGYRGQSTYQHTVIAFRHIDQNWYLWRDY
jgi:hypothetical protein